MSPFERGSETEERRELCGSTAASLTRPAVQSFHSYTRAVRARWCDPLYNATHKCYSIEFSRVFSYSTLPMTSSKDLIISVAVVVDNQQC